ncbi:T9SS type A sorting domain-containing protein [Runella sp.]|uniref:T9SS type A sorting domain-containing protein n=1 Tax=Runella sp. TaxID=1960881 RepID=UPI003D10E2A2
MKPKFYFFSILISIAGSTFLSAQAPPNLTSNVDLTSCSGCTDFAPGAFFSTTTQIVNAFNFARRAEETQLGLPANSLGNLTLPATYGTLSDDQKGLYILNAERMARGGQTYTVPATVTPIGKPVEGVENTLDGVAQSFAQYLFDNNLFGHIGAGGSTPTDRINAAFPANCREFMGRAENIYRACGGSTTFAVEQALFGWIYRDAGSSWGHREAALIQNVDASGNTGYNDNRGAAGNEGFIGIGIVNGSGYTPCGALPARLVVLNIMDPTNDAACTYSIQNNPLPVKLVSFNAYPENNQVNLKWVTSQESGSSHFALYRSTDQLKSFQHIAEVKAKGNSEEKIQYTFTDSWPKLGVNYYRLMQVDLDGRQEASRWVAAVMEGIEQNDEIKIYPNPATSNETIQIMGAELSSMEVNLMDMQGRTLSGTKRFVEEDKMELVPKAVLTPGVYMIHFKNATRSLAKKIIIK